MARCLAAGLCGVGLRDFREMPEWVCSAAPQEQLSGGASMPLTALEAELRARARERIAQELLPSAMPSNVWGGRGVAPLARCAISPWFMKTWSSSTS